MPVDGLAFYLPTPLKVIALKTCLLGGFAWFTHSYRKPDILRVCDQLRKIRAYPENP